MVPVCNTKSQALHELNFEQFKTEISKVFKKYKGSFIEGDICYQISAELDSIIRLYNFAHNRVKVSAFFDKRERSIIYDSSGFYHAGLWSNFEINIDIYFQVDFLPWHTEISTKSLELVYDVITYNKFERIESLEEFAIRYDRICQYPSNAIGNYILEDVMSIALNRLFRAVVKPPPIFAKVGLRSDKLIINIQPAKPYSDWKPLDSIEGIYQFLTSRRK